MGVHNVVVAVVPEIGNNRAAVVAKQPDSGTGREGGRRRRWRFRFVSVMTEGDNEMKKTM